MVCSACGYENLVGNRFCGMCGLPLPHRPLTAAGAQSTLSLTRVPWDAASSAEPTSADEGRVAGDSAAQDARPAKVAGAVLQMPNPDRSSAVVDPPYDPIVWVESLEPPAASKASHAPETEEGEPASSDPPPRELVPPIPFEEYVKSFHYVPPSEPDEVTMRGEAHLPEAHAPAEVPPEVPPASQTPAAESQAPAPLTESSESHAAAQLPEPPVAAADDVRDRLGLAADDEAGERRDRPRFLDINPPLTSHKPPKTRPPAPVIAGPSFLGLGETPAADVSPADDLEAAPPAGGSWRLWLAAAVVLLFAGLGVMEWRSQAAGTNNGPIEVVKMKVRSLRHSNAADTSTPAATPSGSADNSQSKPDIQVEQPSPTQTQGATSNATPSASSSNSPATANANSAPTAVNPAQGKPAGAQPSAGSPPNAASAQPQDSAAAKQAANSAATHLAPSDSVSPRVAEKPKPAAATPRDNDAEVPAGKTAPGADEIARANNASDSAAEAAWLWKATAKGNPDAPVRLANMYVKGDGVPRSCEQAMVLLKTAAMKENARARNRLASMYASGTCVQRNRVEAYRWLSSALLANPSSQWAQQNRDLVWQQMTPEERSQAQKYR